MTFKMPDLKIELLPLYFLDKKDNKFHIFSYVQVLVPDSYTKKEIEVLEE